MYVNSAVQNFPSYRKCEYLHIITLGLMLSYKIQLSCVAHQM